VENEDEEDEDDVPGGVDDSQKPAIDVGSNEPPSIALVVAIVLSNHGEDPNDANWHVTNEVESANNIGHGENDNSQFSQRYGVYGKHNHWRKSHKPVQDAMHPPFVDQPRS